MEQHAMMAALCVVAGPAIIQEETGGWNTGHEQPPARMIAETETSPLSRGENQSGVIKMQDHPYVGIWVTGDGRIRQQLRPNGRYAEARGTRENAYTGRYEVEGNTIQYWDDSGFTADGEFIDGVLYHGGMVMRRQEAEE